MMGGGVGMFGFGMIIWIVILGAVVWAVVQATSRNARAAGARPSSGQAARDVLDARLARGEVSVEEYKKLRETLEVH